MHGPADLKSEQRAHLGLDALEEIISGQSHGNANCGLDQAHKGKSIAGRRLALALSHCSLPSINATAQRSISNMQQLHVKQATACTSIVTFKTYSTDVMILLRHRI